MDENRETKNRQAAAWLTIIIMCIFYFAVLQPMMNNQRKAQEEALEKLEQSRQEFRETWKR